MAGGEFIWGRRQNFADGWVYDDYRIQFSFRYNFAFKFGGKTLRSVSLSSFLLHYLQDNRQGWHFYQVTT